MVGFINFTLIMQISAEVGLFWLLPIAVISIFLSWWYYKGVTWMPKDRVIWKRIVIGLRSLSILILFLLLIGLVFEFLVERKEKPLLITLVDSSSSMKNYSDSLSIQKNLNEKIKRIQEELGEVEHVTMDVSDQTRYFSKQLRFNGNSTDLGGGLEKIQSDFFNRNIGGIVLISDGNYTTENNPIYAAEKFKLTPIFSIGIGDTVKKRDQYIKSINCNEIAFFKNKFPVEIDVEGLKMGKRSSEISIFQGSNLISRQRFTYTDGRYDFQQINFMLDATKLGFIKYTAKLKIEDGEGNITNNERSFYLEVLDAKNQIVIVSNSPHPDISAIKRVLEKDVNAVVTSKLISELDADMSKYDLVIWHDPGNNFNQKLQDQITSKKIAVWYLLGLKSGPQVVNRLGIGLNLSSSKIDDAQAFASTDFNLFELTEQAKNASSFFPPLKAKFGSVFAQQNGSILFYQKIAGVKRPDPLYYFIKKSDHKIGVIAGEGIWRWSMGEFQRTQNNDGFSEIIERSAQFLVTKRNNSVFKVTAPKKVMKDEGVIFHASLYSESMELIGDAHVTLEIRNDAGAEKKYTFGRLGDGYSLDAGKLKPGKYEWIAKASYKGKVFTKRGIFVVDDLSLEDMKSYADHDVLRQISKLSGGKFYPLNEFDSLIKEISNRGDIAIISHNELEYRDLIDFKWLAYLLFVTLIIEWILRRYFGSY